MTNYNTCDKCNKREASDLLVWISAEDFEPKEGEDVPEDLYSKYDALCEDCYYKCIKPKIIDYTVWGQTELIQEIYRLQGLKNSK